MEWNVIKWGSWGERCKPSEHEWDQQVPAVKNDRNTRADFQN